MRTRGVALALALGAGCGDNLPADEIVTATSGSRLAVSWYRYTDGARQPGLDLYDLQEHTPCAPVRWVDDVVRCVPIADDAVFVDDQCREAVGRRQASLPPTHFIGHDRLPRGRVPARLYRAGAVTTRPPSFYERRDGVCVGPFPSPDALVYHRLSGEVDGATLVPLHDDELGDGRLGLTVRWADDGLRLPLGLRDRELDLPCTPRLRPDGSVACEPTTADLASFFGDPDCARSALIVPADREAPPVVKVLEGSGCPSYRALGAELAGPVYRREGAACRATWPGPGERAYAVEREAELPALERAVEQVAGRRLQRIVLAERGAAGGLHVLDDELFDTATRAGCQHAEVDDDDLRCVPANLATALRLATASCGVAVDVVELPRAVCERPQFARSFTADGVVFHAIGDPVLEPLYRVDGGVCRTYTASAGTELRALGPPLDPATFVGAVYFGER